MRLPRAMGAALDAVLINTAGGLTGDDAVEWTCVVDDNAALTVSTAASEKAYRSHGPFARQDTRLSAANGATLAWLPQETIVFDGAMLSRTLDVDLHGDATCLLCEALVFGRGASGEQVRHGRVRDQWRIRRDGALVHAEALDINAATDLGDPSNVAGLGGAEGCRAIATIVWCASLDDEQLSRSAQRVKQTLDQQAMRYCGVSVLPGRLLIRVVAPDSVRLRACIIPMLSLLNRGQDVPRVWYV